MRHARPSATSARLSHTCHLPRRLPIIVRCFLGARQIRAACPHRELLTSWKLHVDCYASKRYLASCSLVRRDVSDGVHVADVARDALEDILDFRGVLRPERDSARRL